MLEQEKKMDRELRKDFGEHRKIGHEEPKEKAGDRAAERRTRGTGKSINGTF